MTPKRAWPLGWWIDELLLQDGNASRYGTAEMGGAGPKTGIPGGQLETFPLCPQSVHSGCTAALVTSCRSDLLPRLCPLPELRGAPRCPARPSCYPPGARASALLQGGVPAGSPSDPRCLCGSSGRVASGAWSSFRTPVRPLPSVGRQGSPPQPQHWCHRDLTFLFKPNGRVYSWPGRCAQPGTQKTWL